MLHKELIENIEKIFDDIDNFLNKIEDNSTNGFDCIITNNEEVYIIDKIYNNFINWYKLTHIGRDFHTDMKTDEEIIHFLKRFHGGVFYEEDEEED